MDQGGKGGYTSLQQLHSQVKRISKERFVIFRNVNDCKIYGLRMYERQQTSRGGGGLQYLSQQQLKWIQKMNQLYKQLDKVDKDLFLPTSS